MYSSFHRNWPIDVELFFYPEGFSVGAYENVTILDFPQWFLEWKESHKNNLDAHGLDKTKNRPKKRNYDYRRNCVRFAHKIAVLTDAALNYECDLLIWMDCDVITHHRVTVDWLRRLFPEKSREYMAWLWRTKTYPECGFLMFRGRHPRHVPFMETLLNVYRSNDVFNYGETHDSYIFQELARERFTPYNLAGPSGSRHHSVFDFSPLRQRLEHLKGGRKPKVKYNEVKINDE